jgi:hypothetical protein
MSLSPQPLRSPITSRQAQQVVASRAVIDQAKGVLIMHFRVDAKAAFQMLRAWAAETDSTPQVVAQTLIHGVCLQETTRSWDPCVLAYVAAQLGELPDPQPRRVTLPRPRWTN